MFDNLTVDRRGHVLMQEDPGAQNYLARIWQYDIASDTLTEVAHHDPDRFAPGGSKFLTIDEESSGIVDAEKILGKGWYLFDVQAHYTNPTPSSSRAASCSRSSSPSSTTTATSTRRQEARRRLIDRPRVSPRRRAPPYADAPE